MQSVPFVTNIEETHTYTLNYQTHTQTDWTRTESNQTNKIFYE